MYKQKDAHRGNGERPKQLTNKTESTRSQDLSQTEPGRDRRRDNAGDKALPPPDTGKRLATVQRGESAELRVSLRERTAEDGTADAFLDLRIWFINGEGDWWPTKRGVTFRASEPGAQEVVDAMAEGLARLQNEGGHDASA